MSEHRDKAVEAATEAYFKAEPRGATRTIVSHAFRAALDAADPHLRAQHFEEFREALLGDATDVGEFSHGGQPGARLDYTGAMRLLATLLTGNGS